MATVITKKGNSITIQTTIELTGSMFEMETIIQSRINEVGLIATSEALSRFDTTGSQINIASMKLTSKGKVAKEYQRDWT